MLPHLMINFGYDRKMDFLMSSCLSLLLNLFILVFPFLRNSKYKNIKNYVNSYEVVPVHT
jgi:hypothetical protein